MNADRLQALRARDQSLTLIPGVSDYCDGWCDRCPLRWRCAVFDSQRRYLAAMRAGDESFARHMNELIHTDELGPPLPPDVADEWAEFRTDASGSPPLDEGALDRFQRQLDRHRARTEAHPLPRSASEYADLARGIIDGLGALRARGGVAAALTCEPARSALETISRLAPTLAVKTRRAVAYLVPGHPAGDPPQLGVPGDPGALPPDANGCAKVARLLIRESQDGWQALLDAPRPIADGVPAAMLARLGTLDGQMRLTFPHAMRFVRPGFDDATLPV